MPVTLSDSQTDTVLTARASSAPVYDRSLSTGTAVLRPCLHCREFISTGSQTCIFCGKPVNFAEEAQRRAKMRRQVREEMELRRKMPVGGMTGSLGIGLIGCVTMFLSVLGILHFDSGSVTPGSIALGLGTSVALFTLSVKGVIAAGRVARISKG